MPPLRPQRAEDASAFSRSEERRRKAEAVLAAAGRRFDAEGLATARLEDVAADLGLTKTGILYYFETKEDLAAALYAASVRALAAALDAGEAGGTAPAERITATVRCYADRLVDSAAGRGPYLAALRELDALGEDTRISLAEQVAASVERLNALVAEWAETAAVGRPEPVTLLILGLLDWLCDRHRMTGSPAEIASARDAVLDLICGGLRTDTREAPALPAGGDEGDDLSVFDRDARNRMKREAFIRTGTRLFNQKGFGGVALSEVAGALGVTRGAFYYHIADKSEFLDQCVERSLEHVERALDRAETAHPAAMDQIHAALLDLAYQQMAGVTPLIRPELVSALPPARRRRHAARLRNVSRRLGDALEEAISAGEAREVDTAVIEKVLTSAAFLNGGYTLAAAGSINPLPLSEEPLAAASDYLHVLIQGLERRP